jgi:hypothetical protein
MQIYLTESLSKGFLELKSLQKNLIFVNLNVDICGKFLLWCFHKTLVKITLAKIPVKNHLTLSKMSMEIL